MRKEVRVALSKAFDKVEEGCKISGLKIEINSMKAKIKDNEKEIGEFTSNNQNKFTGIDEVLVCFDKIKSNRRGD